jgi:hypothetical protein
MTSTWSSARRSGPRGNAKAEALLTDIRRAVCGVLVAEGAEVLDREIALDSIWTYERAEGRRLSVPWLFEGAMRDVVQIDVVFREPLQDAPSLEPLRFGAAAHGYRDTPRRPSLWFASRAESLAWKLLWLETDMNPQAKDLYDAILLAEDVALPVQLARRVFESKGSAWSGEANTRFVREWHVEWESFAQEYPALAARGDRATWLDRLATTLKLTA